MRMVKGFKYVRGKANPKTKQLLVVGKSRKTGKWHASFGRYDTEKEQAKSIADRPSVALKKLEKKVESKKLIKQRKGWKKVKYWK